jgi:hypothetical protein
MIRPPSSRLGPSDDVVRQKVLRRSPIAGLYEKEVDRESAFELLRARAERRVAKEQKAESAAEREKIDDDQQAARRSGTGRRTDSMSEAIIKSVVRSAGSQFGRTVVRSLMRGFFR